VLDVPFVKGLSISADYWEIRRKNIISAGGGIPDDTAALNAATQAALARGTAIGAIDLGSGTGSYQGDSAVVRLPVTQADRDAFAAYNATRAPGNQRAVVGAIDILRSSYFNRAQEFVNGFDFDVTYKLPRFAVGNVTLNTSWTLLNDFHGYTAAGAARTEYRGSNAAGTATTKWRGATTVAWTRKEWGAGLGAYYTGDFTDTGATTTQLIWDGLGRPSYIRPVVTNGTTVYRYVVRDSISYNAYVTYRVQSQHRWLARTSVRLGVNNLLDLEPPLSADSRGYEPSLYNVMARGRTYSLQFTKKL